MPDPAKESRGKLVTDMLRGEGRFADPAAADLPRFNAFNLFAVDGGTARLLTNRLDRQVGLSVVFALTATFAGFGLAAYGPLALGGTNSVSGAGMIAVVSGLQLAAACAFAPRKTRSRIGAADAV